MFVILEFDLDNLLFKHWKYTILAHRLAAIHGWLPSKLRLDRVHSRTYGVGMGRQFHLDSKNEILNRLFKNLLESSTERYTDSTTLRCSQITGPLGDALVNVYDIHVVDNELYRHRCLAQNRSGHVSRLKNY